MTLGHADRRHWWPSALLTLLTLLVAPLAACGSDDSDNGDTARPAATSIPAATSSPTATAALAVVLRRAVQEERGAKATYDNVLAEFGQIRPFVAIAKSEARHIDALETVAKAHGIDLSDVKATGSTSPRTLAAACAMGVAAERADVALYDDLLPQVQAYPDVVRALTNLRAASQDSHLPAFQRC